MLGAGDVFHPQSTRLAVHTPWVEVAWRHHARVTQARERGEEEEDESGDDWCRGMFCSCHGPIFKDQSPGLCLHPWQFGAGSWGKVLENIFSGAAFLFGFCIHIIVCFPAGSDGKSVVTCLQLLVYLVSYGLKIWNFLFALNRIRSVWFVPILCHVLCYDLLLNTIPV